MNKLILFFVFISSAAISQDSPMFDSLDYFTRNKIKTVHFYVSPWYYSPPWHYVKKTFNKNTNTLKCDSMGFDDPNSPMANYFNKSNKGKSFNFRDTILIGTNGGYNDTVQHFYDNKGRLYLLQRKTATLTYNSVTASVTGIDKNEQDKIMPFILNINYFYYDSTKKIKKIISEDNYHKEVQVFYYSQSLLSTKTTLDSNKMNKQIRFETTVYDYYPDKKLKKETRRSNTERCPNICEGIIEYKYDTEFPNDSTPSGIKPIPFQSLIKIKNERKTDICVLITGYDLKKKNIVRKRCFESIIEQNKTYEVAFDPRPDQGIYPLNQDWFVTYKKNDFKGFEILVYRKPIIFHLNSSEPKDTILFEKCKTVQLFKTPKEIIIK